MRITFLGGVAVAALLSASLTAQVAPAIVKVTGTGSGSLFIPPLPALGPAVLTGSTATISAAQFELRAISGTPNTFRLGATVSPVPGRTFSGVLEGEYNPLTQAFTPRMSGGALTVQALNAEAPAGFGLSITADGLLCTFDAVTLFGGPQWSRRTVDGAPWAKPKPIVFSQGGPYTFIDGKLFTSTRDPVTRAPLAQPTLYYAYHDVAGGGGGTGDILVGTFDVTGAGAGVTATVNNIQTLFSLSSFPGAASIHSPHSMKDETGQVCGWVLNVEVATGDSDTYWIPGINNTVDGAQEVYDDQFSAWQNNGTGTGNSGSWVMVYGPTPENPDGAPLDMQVVAINGDSWPALTGGPVNVRVFVPYEASTVIWQVQLWLGVSTPPIPIVLPGLTIIGNGLGTVATGRPPALLGVLPLVFFPTLPVVTPGGATYSFTAPAVAGAATIQAVAVRTDLASPGIPTIYFSNTATLAGL